MTSRYSSLHQRLFAVTGGAAGIGEACVHRLLEQGAYVTVMDSDQDALDALVSAISPEYLKRTIVTSGDVADAEGTSAWLRKSVHRFGPLSGTVAAAGIELPMDSATHSLTDEVWRTTMTVNLDGLFHTFRAAATVMIEAGFPGSFVYIGSPTGYFGCELGHHAYSASKGGGFGLARVMATEYARYGLRVNTVWPGFIATGMNADVTSDPQATRNMMSAIPVGRPGLAAEVAAAVLFLLSEDSSYCTGSVLTVDGGLTAFIGGQSLG